MADVTVFSPRKVQRATAIDSPITAEKRLSCCHDGARCVSEGKAPHANPTLRSVRCSAHFHQVLQAHNFDNRVLEIRARRRIEVEVALPFVEKPLAGLGSQERGYRSCALEA